MFFSSLNGGVVHIHPRGIPKQLHALSRLVETHQGLDTLLAQVRQAQKIQIIGTLGLIDKRLHIEILLIL